MGARGLGQWLVSNYVKKGAVRVHEGILGIGSSETKSIHCHMADILELKKMLQ